MKRSEMITKINEILITYQSCDLLYEDALANELLDVIESLGMKPPRHTIKIIPNEGMVIGEGWESEGDTES